jgi:hypothetical protein
MTATSRILPPGHTLPPLVAVDSGNGAQTPPAGGKGRKRPGRRPKRHGDRFAVLNQFVDVTARTLPRAPALVWLTLWRDTRDGVARTAVADLARRTGVDERTVMRALSRLVADRLVEVVHRGGLGRGVSVYRVTPVSPYKVTFCSNSR